MRSATDRRIAGVCAGIAEYFEIDPTIVRLASVVAVFIPLLDAVALLGYPIAWIVIPAAPLPASPMQRDGSSATSPVK